MSVTWTTVVPVLPLNTYAAGAYALGPAAIPSGVTAAQLTFDLTHLTALTMVLEMGIQISLDNGVTWPITVTIGLDLPKSGFTLNGSVITDVAGKVITEWPGGVSGIPLGANRKVKGTISISEDFTTSGTLSLA